MKIIIFLFFLFMRSFVEAQLPNYAPTNNLEGFYSFSGNILDNSGNGHNNANYNVISTTDRFNTQLRALYFSGSGTEYLNYGDVDAFEPYQASFSFWILPEAYGSISSELQKPIISKWSSSNDLIGSSYRIYLTDSDLCFLLTDGITTDTITTPIASIPLSEWSHIVISANYGFIKCYVNNQLVVDATSPISSINFTNSEFKVGGWYHDSDPNYSSFTGKIDDIGIWSRELLPCEVEALYQGSACATSGMDVLDLEEKELIKITDLLGRETGDTPNTPLIYMFSDGTTKKVYRVE